MSGPRENCLKHREYCFTLLEDSRGEIFGEWIIDLDGLCIWRWYEVRSKYLQNSFVYLSSRHVAGFWRLVLSSSWIASCFRNHCSHAQTVYRHLKRLSPSIYFCVCVVKKTAVCCLTARKSPPNSSLTSLLECYAVADPG